MKFIFVPIMCLAIACCAISCKKGTDSSTTETTSSLKIQASTTTNINNDAFIKLVNDTRLAGCNCGSTVMPPVSPLTWNANLVSAAVYQANYMSQNKIMTHDSENKTSVADRAKAAGYNWTTIGENVGEGSVTEAQIFDAWLKSESHCKNIMNASFKEMGAARAGIYWAHVFGAK